MKRKNLILMIIAGLFVCFSWTSVFAESATKEECIAKVQAAMKIAVDQGIEEAFKQVGDKNGPFVWKDTYVFATSADQAVTQAHPIKPGLVGKNLLHVKDVNGVLIFAEIAKIASSASGKGWIDYMWPKPGEKKPSQKHTYVEKVPDTNTALCAGYYE